MPSSNNREGSRRVFGPRFIVAGAGMVIIALLGIGAIDWAFFSSPAVKSFSADPQEILQGQTTTLFWSVEGAKSISISGGIGVVKGSSVLITPTAAATYTITAENSAGVATAKTTVLVAPPPSHAVDPILLITTASNRFSGYYSEVLHAEGFNEFSVADISTATASTLRGVETVILGDMPLTSDQVKTLASWVEGGGNLIAMRPDKALADLLGITAATGTIADKYIRIDTKQSPGAGITATTIQYHGTADLYRLNGSRAVARLYSDATTPTEYPAVTLRRVGLGSAAAFAFDLARSIVYTRQGNPAWAGQNRDGDLLIRSDDLFYPDYLDLSKVAVPQADEMQRLLGNLILMMQRSGNKRPLLRFWYFPKMYKAVIVATGDDHATRRGTQTVFDQFLAASPKDCSVADWQCYRATSWIYANTPLSAKAAERYVAQGFDIGDHVSTDCKDYKSTAALDAIFAGDLKRFVAKFPNLPPQTGNRTHCAVWSDWASVPKVERMHGIRFDMGYYYWPASWVQNRSGFMNGSGIPMRYADVDGTAVDVYQQTSHLVNENGETWPDGIESMIKHALGPEGYYGAFGTHYDYRGDGFPENLLSSAKRNGVPIVSAQQVLSWVDGRNNSAFKGVLLDGSTLKFAVAAATGTHGLYAMLPIGTHSLQSITYNGTQVPFSTSTIKGVMYALFPAPSGHYIATFTSTHVTTDTSRSVAVPSP